MRIVSTIGRRRRVSGPRLFFSRSWFGMLALAVVFFCLRALQDEAQWARAEPWIKVGFWGLNVGLGLMVVLDLFPAGVLQFLDCLKNGYWHAHSQEFMMSGLFHKRECARAAADGVFLIFGVMPVVFAALLSVYQILSRPQSAPPDIRPETASGN